MKNNCYLKLKTSVSLHYAILSISKESPHFTHQEGDPSSLLDTLLGVTVVVLFRSAIFSHTSRWIPSFYASRRIPFGRKIRSLRKTEKWSSPNLYKLSSPKSFIGDPDLILSLIFSHTWEWQNCLYCPTYIYGEKNIIFTKTKFLYVSFWKKLIYYHRIWTTSIIAIRWFRTSWRYIRWSMFWRRIRFKWIV